MNLPEAIFEIIEENNCPLYELGNFFKLSGKALMLEEKAEKTFITTAVIRSPQDKPVCRILVGDLTALLVKYESMTTVNRCVINCSGCSGLIRLEYTKEKSDPTSKILTEKKEKGDDIGAIASLLYMFPIFQPFDEKDIRDLVPYLRLKKYAKGDVILHKGEPGSNLFIIVSGKAEVIVDDGIIIGTMTRGEVFGEISLLIGTPIGATIKVVEVVTVLFITGKDFRKVLNRYPSLQMYFAKLLAERLSKTNDERQKDFGSGMIGQLSEMSPSELFQTLNLNHKTGVLNLALTKGTAKASFNEGGLVHAEYGKLKGKEAFFEILRSKTGRYQFVQGLPEEQQDFPEIGDFMFLLMEGIRKMDEENEKANNKN